MEVSFFQGSGEFFFLSDQICLSPNSVFLLQKGCIYYPFYLRKGQLLAKEKLSWKSILYVDAKPKLMVHVETWKDRISVLIYSVFVLVTRVWVYRWIFSKQNSSVLCTHVLVASH